MVEVGIPVFKAKKTLAEALDSLVSQIYKQFLVCLSIDGDGEDYKDIIQEYRNRGLNIRIIYGQSNGGPGIARQRILDTTQCDYLIYMDADDVMTPRAVGILYKEAKKHNYDILRSSLIREQNNGNDILMSANENIITWFHGKIYRVQYLRDKNINFHPTLRTDEDSYFNMIAWNSTQMRGMMNEVTYIWRDNNNSLTRGRSQKEYFLDTYMNYIGGQVEALKFLYKINGSIEGILITSALINIYNYYMKGRFYDCNEEVMDKSLFTLRNETWMKMWLNEGQNWIDALNLLKPGCIYEDQYVIFYEETFNNWITRLFTNKGDNDE